MNGEQRRRETPSRSREGNRGDANPSQSRTRSRSRIGYSRERDLDLDRERVRRLERELQREREILQQHERSLRRTSTASASHRTSAARPGAHRSDEDDRHAGSDRGRRTSHIRSRSPSLSTTDVAKIIRSIKHGLEHQPLSQSNAQFSKNIDHKNILPSFDPSLKNQRIDIWLKKVNECAAVYGWDDRTTIHFSLQKLQELAKTWFESLDTILYSWSEWQAKLISAFPYELNYGQCLEDMLKRKSRFNESIETYYYEKLALINLCDIKDKRAVDCIIHGISDRTMKSSALALRCSHPEQLLQFLMSSKDTTSYQQPFHLKNRNGLDGASTTGGSGSATNTRKNFSHGIFCFNCKERGHPYLQCPKPLVKCSRCNRIGHKTETCFIKRGESINADTVPKTMCISSSSPNAKFTKEVCIDGTVFESFIDFGSEMTLIRESIVQRIGKVYDNTVTVMKGFGNKLVQSLGSVSLDLQIDGVGARVLCRVVDDQLLEKPLLIGQSFTEQPHIIVYKDSTCLQFLDVGSQLPQLDSCAEHGQSLKGKVVSNVQLFGIASVGLCTDTVYDGDVLLSTKLVGRPNNKFLVCGGVYPVKHGQTYVTVRPVTVPCLLQGNAVICRVENVKIVSRVTKEVSKGGCAVSHTVLGNKTIDENQIKLGQSVDEVDKRRLMDLLHRYKHCFASSLSELGCSEVTEMNIELNSQKPVVYRPYRLSHSEREKVRGMVNEMLEARIIRESTSDYACPIILVRKKDGSTRLCVDYRMLNAITLKERYPMPIIEDEIARLSGQAWFVSLDLMSGYYQVPIAEDSKRYTAFVTPDGQYEFNRMPFGLANAPAVFQRMMNGILGSARYSKATVYIDDLLIYGENSKQCLDRLEDIMKLIETANLTLNLSKCSFLQNKIDYLGYEISADGVKPGTAKIQCVRDFPRPENVHAVRQFLGLVSYFRKFVMGFALIAYPLNKLLKKDTTWEWSDAQEHAFLALKECLVDRPVLTIFDPNAELELHTDASKLGVGSILLQRVQGNNSLQPVAYYSRQTSPEEKVFHSYELETLAVICSLKKFRVYLLGKTFKIVTDCSALRSTFNKRDLIPRIARWWLLIQEFDCSVEYRAGTKMAHVDALSRNPISEKGNPLHDVTTNVLSISDLDWLLTLQLGDTELGRIRDILSNNVNDKELQYINNGFVIRDNKLFRYIDEDKNEVRWVVPKGARWQICRMSHDEMGHLGFEKTLERIKRNYWFLKMTRFIKKYVGACIECAYAKKSSNTREGLLHPIPKADIPFHTLHMDHVGPFVKSKRGYTHILVVVDSFTKFVFIKPVKNTKAQSVICVLEEVFYTFRNPDRMISDRGSCFTSHLFKRFCLNRGIKHVLNAVASPRSNGQVERYNRTILNSLTAQNLKDDEKEWDKKLGIIQWGLNNTVQKTTGRTPSEVMFGTKMNSELNPAMNEIRTAPREAPELTSIRNEVKEKIDKEQQRQSEYYDRNRKPARIYQKGELVKVLRSSFNNEGKSTKLMPSYEGPFKVVKILGNDRYRVAPIPGFEGTKSKRKTTVAANRLQPWIHIASLEINNDESDSDRNATDSE